MPAARPLDSFTAEEELMGPTRRGFLKAAGAVGAVAMTARLPEAAAQTRASPAARSAARGMVAGGYVLGPEDGEVLVRPNGRIVVKVDPRTGSHSMAVGTQDLDRGAGIPIHRHDTADEVLMIQNGHAHAKLDGRTVEVGPGSAVYVPRGTWHGVENTGEPIHLWWVVTPPGLEEFFRAIGASPGMPVKKLTPVEIAEIGRQHGTVFQPPKTPPANAPPASK
jgi:quercetin dioxygenase-like cupin family protein